MNLKTEKSHGQPPSIPVGLSRNDGRRASAVTQLYHRSGDGEPVYCDNGGREVVVGTLGSDGVFRKTVEANHVLRRPAAIAVQLSVMNFLKSRGCLTVEAHLYDGRVLYAPLERFWTRGFELDRGYGKQRALGLAHWEQRNSPQLSLQGLL